MPKTTKRFVEVGAFDCESWSHTHSLAVEGWQGLMFEPQPDMVAKCKACYKDYPNVVIDECAIGRHNRDVKLYLYGSLTTVREDMIPVFNKQGYGIDSKHYRIVHMHTLDERLEYHLWQPNFDLLVVDVEGAEQEVLEGFTISKWLPKRAIIEACDPCPDVLLAERTAFVRKYMKENRYAEVEQDGFDIIFELQEGIA
jgi:FkbM family methyltransferase